MLQKYTWQFTSPVDYLHLFDFVLQCKSVIDKYEPLIWDSVLELMVSIRSYLFYSVYLCDHF